MRRTHRLPARLIRWASLCVCFALILASLTLITPISSGSGFIPQGRNGQANNGKGKRVTPAPPLPGAPAGTFPSLEETRQRPHVEPAARQPILSTMRSRRKALESRQGRRVGDPLPPKRRASANETGDGSERVSIASADAHDRVGIVRSHHARTTRSLPQGPFSGDIRPLSFYLFKHRNVPALNHQAFNFLRYPGSHLADQREASIESAVSTEPAETKLKHIGFDLFFAPMPQSGSSRIAFSSNRDGSMQIYVMNSDGSGQTRLTYSGANDDCPRWSPNGAKILSRATVTIRPPATWISTS